MNFNELMQAYVNLPYEGLVDIAKRSMDDLRPEMLSHLGSVETLATAYIAMAVACVGADNQLSSLECKFLGDLLRIDADYDKIMNLARNTNIDEAMDLVDKLADSLSSDGKAQFLSICIALLAVDETISRPEVDFIKKLIG